MRGRKTDPDQVVALWNRGLSSKEIAARFDCTYPAINKILRERGFPARQVKAQSKKTEGVGQPAPVLRAEAFAALGDAVSGMGQSHAGRAEIAAHFGVPLRRVEQEWHRLRAGRAA